MRPGTRIPETLEEAISLVVAELSETSRQVILNQAASPASAHMGAGQAIRNDFGLWHNSALAQHMLNRFGLAHADDTSAIILAGVFAAVRGQPFDPEPQAQRYRESYIEQGLDPKTLLKLGEPKPVKQSKRDWLSWTGIRRGGNRAEGS